MLVAIVWLLSYATLARAVPIVTEQYVALRAVLDGVGMYRECVCRSVIDLSDVFARPGCVPSAINSTCELKSLNSSYDCTTGSYVSLRCYAGGNVTFL